MYTLLIVSKSFPFIAQKLAVELAMNALTGETADVLKSVWPEEECRNRLFTSVVVRTGNRLHFPEEAAESFEPVISGKVLQNLKFEQSNIAAIAGFLDNHTTVFHFNRKIVKTDEFARGILHTLYKDISIACHGGMRVTIAAGMPVASWTDLHKSFQSAMHISKRQFFSERDRILFYEQPAGGAFTFTDSLLDRFYELLMQNKKEEALLFVDKLARDISRFQDTDTGYVRNVFYKIFRILEEAAKERNIAIDLTENGSSYFWQEISKIETLYDIAGYIKVLINSFFSEIEDRGSQSRFMYEIIRYIEKNYADRRLSVKQIAEKSHYGYSYLCTLFKKNTGKTINDYITQVRLEKAREMIRQRNVKLHDVAGLVGYSDPSYFTKIFKKHTGSIPSVFREMQ